MANIKAAIIGCGTIFPMHAYPISRLDGVDLVAVCDINKDAANKACNEFNCKAYYDYKELIKDEGVDVIHICTPHYLHPKMAIDALNASKHVLTEKPMAIEYTDALSMIETSKTNKKTLGIIFQNRYNKSSQLIKNTLESNELGKVISAKLSVTWHRDDLYYSSSTWRGTWEKEGGGVLINQAIHTFDLVRWFIGSEVISVDAFMANRFHKDIEVEDCAEGVIQFKNGAIASFHAINYYGYDAPPKIEIVCEKGIADLTAEKATISFKNGKTLTCEPDPDDFFEYGDNVKGYWGVAHNTQIKHFYNSIKTGQPLDITAEDVLKTQKMMFDIYNSGKEKWGV